MLSFVSFFLSFIEFLVWILVFFKKNRLKNVNYKIVFSHRFKKFHNILFFINENNTTSLTYFFSLRYRKLNITQINDDFWHHVAIIIGHKSKKIILDGFTIYNTTKLNHSLPLLHGGGVVAIGQKLECVNGVFDPNMSFVGKISYLNLWNIDITRDKSCPKMMIIDECISGLNESTFVIKWNLVYQFASGNVTKVPSLPKFGKLKLHFYSNRFITMFIKIGQSQNISREFYWKWQIVNKKTQYYFL